MINLQSQIIGEDGNVAMVRMPQTKIIDGKKQTITVEVEATAYRIIREVLLAMPESDNEVIEKKYDLFCKINGKDEVELTEEEKKLILGDIAAKNSTLFAAQIIKLLKNV